VAGPCSVLAQVPGTTPLAPTAGGEALWSRATGGMVATTDRVASEIGAAVLRRGGNAVDAAVATFFALAVVNPEAGNIGGGGFLVLRLPDGTAAALDFRETAPGAAHARHYLDAQGNPTDRILRGHMASGVPGSVAGMWEVHQRHGSRPWGELLDPAINLAEGIVVHERLARSLGAYTDRFGSPEAGAIFLPGGRAPDVGDRLVQEDLARTLRRIGESGLEDFYTGTTADLLVEEIRRGGGLITHDDLAAYRAHWRDPIVFEYRGHRVISMPPPSSGGATVASILNILEGYDLEGMGRHSAAHLHLFAEAAKRAFSDRNTYLGDPDFVPLPLARMLSPEYAALRRGEIHPDRATPARDVQPGLGATPDGGRIGGAEPAGGEHTTHFSIVDGQGAAIAVTTTLNSLYGSQVLVRGAGFFLNNQMDDFTLLPGVPNQFGLVQGESNAIAPGKRMLSAMTPTIVVAPEGRVRLVTGSPGGPTIITTVAQMISNVVDWGFDLTAATHATRVHHQHLPDVLLFERGGLPSATVERLRQMGHVVEERPGYQGDTQSIAVLPDGSLIGVADPRRGGAAVAVREEWGVVQ
jgi:gamma-glutamyltranspeptidase / glutathione hydrolase